MFDRRILLVIAMLMAASVASAQSKGASQAASSGVSYSGIDASTLRVFTVGTVGVGIVQGPGFQVEVASPQSGHGTGFAVSPELIITAYHVVDGARHVVIRLPGDGGFLPARVVYSSKEEDISVLRVDATLKPIALETDEQPLRVRQTVYAVGYPLDPSRTQAQSAKGIIAGHLADSSLQLDISLNPGNSGGPLVDENDRVIGMVIARGDVEKGIQGIGVAVPMAKLRTALAEAQRQIGAGLVAPISPHEKMSAQVVDELVRQGALHPVRQHEDLKRSLDSSNIREQIEQLASRLDDADLLVYVGASLWNAGLAISIGGVRAIGDRTLDEQEARRLAYDLHSEAVRLVNRGSSLDASVGGRSSFVAIALRPEAAGVGGEVGGSAITLNRGRYARWTLQASRHALLNDSAEGGSGWGAELKRQGYPGRVFFSVGMSVGFISMVTTDHLAVMHSFVAAELGLGTRFALNSTAHVELYAGIAPSYYSVESTDNVTETVSELVADHFRATLSLAFRRWCLGTGLRSIRSEVWFEPIGLGINF